MIKIKLLSVGKTKEAWLDEAIAEYIKRLQGDISFEFVWAKDDAQLVALAQKEPHLICLDAAGKAFTSEQFAHFLEDQWQRGGSRLTIVIGGAEGLPLQLKAKSVLVSLSPLTFTHQIARLILIEQIYRTHEILRGSPYHK